MKTTSILAAVFVVCFLLGVGLVAMTPADVTADIGPRPVPCSDCYITICGGPVGTCGYGYVPYNKAYSGLLCEAPFNCRYEFIGCGFPC